MDKQSVRWGILGAAILVISSWPLMAQEYSGVKKATESKEYEDLKRKYRDCVVANGVLYVKVAPIDSAINHAQISCKRELLSIRQFLLSGAFKVEVIDQLIGSVREGTEIDLVNSVYDEVLKRKGIKR